MLDKSEFYHGAAIIRVMEHPSCNSVRKLDKNWYAMNGDTLTLIKYTTKNRTPWRFSFDSDDLDGAKSHTGPWKAVCVALVCGGDGVCALSLAQCEYLLGGKAGWISARRKFNERYAVAGAAGELRHKVPVSMWPLIVFDSKFYQAHN